MAQDGFIDGPALLAQLRRADGLGEHARGGVQSQTGGTKEQATVFPWKKKTTTQLAQLPYQDLIIADTRQGGVSHKTSVGSNFIRDINKNK